MRGGRGERGGREGGLTRGEGADPPPSGIRVLQHPLGLTHLPPELALEVLVALGHVPPPRQARHAVETKHQHIHALAPPPPGAPRRGAGAPPAGGTQPRRRARARGRPPSGTGPRRSPTGAPAGARSPGWAPRAARTSRPPEDGGVRAVDPAEARLRRGVHLQDPPARADPIGLGPRQSRAGGGSVGIRGSRRGSSHRSAVSAGPGGREMQGYQRRADHFDYSNVGGGGNYWSKKLFWANICVLAPSAPTSIVAQNKGPDTEPHFSNPPLLRRASMSPPPPPPQSNFSGRPVAATLVKPPSPPCYVPDCRPKSPARGPTPGGRCWAVGDVRIAAGFLVCVLGPLTRCPKVESGPTMQ